MRSRRLITIIGTFFPAVIAGFLFSLSNVVKHSVLAFDVAEFWVFFASLFAIMNPVVTIPLFVSITEGRPAAYRQRLSLLCALTVMMALISAAMVGREVLASFAIGIGSFRIAGGIIVLLMGLSLLQAKLLPGSPSSGGGEDGKDPDSQAVCPLAIPLLAGPGAIATIILKCEGAASMADYVIIGSVILTMVVVVYITLRMAAPLTHLLGRTGLTVITRLSGMIVAAIAVDMIVIGVRNFFPGLT